MRRNIYQEYVTTDSLAWELHEKYVYDFSVTVRYASTAA